MENCTLSGELLVKAIYIQTESYHKLQTVHLTTISTIIITIKTESMYLISDELIIVAL